MARPPRPHKPTQHRPRQAASHAHEDTQKITGLPAVAALFARDPARAERLFYEEKSKAGVGEFCKHLAAAHKPYRMVSTEELTKIAGTPLHGGIVAVARPKPVRVYDAEEAKAWAKAGQPLMVLDGVGNPHNLGAIARTMAFFGVERLLVSDHPGQAVPSDAAFRVAEGGLEWVEIYRVRNLALELKRLAPIYRVVGTALGSHRPVGQVLAKGPRPLAVVLGNEENGLPPATLAACEEIATLPGSGRVQSLNVAATAAILVHLLAGV